MEQTKQNQKNYQKYRTVSFVLIGLLIAWATATFLIVPNLNLLVATFFEGGRFSFGPFIQILTSDRVNSSLSNSVLLALALSITVNLLGIFIVLVTEYFEIKGSRFIKIGYYSTLVSGGLVIVTVYDFLFGDRGFLTQNLMQLFPSMDPTWFKGFPAVLFVMTFSGTSNHLLFLTNALRSIDQQTIEAAQNMGIPQWRILAKVVLPVLKPTIFALTILTFLSGMNAFSAPMVLGGETFRTINPLILAFAQTLNSRNYAAIMAVFLGFISILLLAFMNKVESKGNYMSVSKVKTPLRKQKIQNKVANIVIHALTYLTFVIYTFPIVFILLFSFLDVQSLYTGVITADSFSLDNYRAVFGSPNGFEPILVSVLYSGLAAAIVVMLMLFVGRIIFKYRNKWTAALEYMLHIPWFLPGTLIALGLVMTYDRPRLWIGNNILTGTLGILLLGYIIVNIPFTLRMIKATYYSLDPVLEEAAKNLGASTGSAFRKVILPIITPSAISVFLLNFIGQLTDYDLSVFLFHPLYQPLGVVIRQATTPEASPQAQMLTFVYAVITMLLSSIAIYIVYGRKANVRGSEARNVISWLLENASNSLKSIWVRLRKIPNKAS